MPSFALPAAAYLASLGTPASRRGMETALRTASEILSGQRQWQLIDWTQVNAAVVQGIRGKRYRKPRHEKQDAGGFEGCCTGCFFNLRSLAPRRSLRIKEVRGDRGSRLPAGRDISTGELALLMRECCDDSSVLGVRDAAIIAVAACTSSRRAEIAGLWLRGHGAPVGRSLSNPGYRKGQQTAVAFPSQRGT